MVLPLKKVIENLSNDEASVREALLSFHSVNSKNKEEVEDFLWNKSIPMELNKQSVTYLVANDEADRNGECVIDGYFTIALKVFRFNSSVSNRRRRMIAGKIDNHVPAFLIGQLARSENTKSGFGKTILQTAIGYIISASKIIGGQLIYVDCIDEFIDYYQRNDFTYIQKNKANGLSQLYFVI